MKNYENFILYQKFQLLYEYKLIADDTLISAIKSIKNDPIASDILSILDIDFIDPKNNYFSTDIQHPDTIKFTTDKKVDYEIEKDNPQISPQELYKIKNNLNTRLKTSGYIKKQDIKTGRLITSILSLNTLIIPGVSNITLNGLV